MSAKPIKSILFVCLGNICRSPLAEGVLRTVLAERGADRDIVLDSAATGSWEAGSAPDPRSVAVAMHHGIDISAQRAHHAEAGYDDATHILAPKFLIGTSRSLAA